MAPKTEANISLLKVRFDEIRREIQEAIDAVDLNNGEIPSEYIMYFSSGKAGNNLQCLIETAELLSHYGIDADISLIVI